MKTYQIKFNNKTIGTTNLEKADAPMGVVFGKIKSLNEPFNYDFLKSLCYKNNIELVYDHPEDKLIATSTIEQLQVISPAGIEVKGLGNQIEGMDSDAFYITIVGIHYLFYEEEFPHHTKDYNSSE